MKSFYFMSCLMVSLIIKSTALFASGWLPAVTISVPGSPILPDIVINDSGYSVALWDENPTVAVYSVESATLPFGQAWTPQVTIEGGLITAPKSVIGLDQFGNATAAWISDDGTNKSIKVSTLPEGGSWSTPISVSAVFPSGTNLFTVAIAVDSVGDIVVMWVELDSGFFCSESGSKGF